MNKTTIDTLQHNLIVELRKKEIDQEEKRALLKDYMARHKLSIRQLAKEFGVPHTTIYYWIEPEKKSEQNEEQKANNKLKLSKNNLNLNELKNNLEAYLILVREHKAKVNDQSLKLIDDIKELVNEIYLRTRKVKVD